MKWAQRLNVKGMESRDGRLAFAWPCDWKFVRRQVVALAIWLWCALFTGCASMRTWAPSDLSPCIDGFAQTEDGWKLGVRHYTPNVSDPNKLPVVLCHGLGLNGTFWTITDNHLPSQLIDRGYHVFVVDLRGSGGSYRKGPVGKINRLIRETALPEIRGGDWTVDDLARYDVPAILHYVENTTGAKKVNWVGHSLGGMLMFPFLELSEERDRIQNFVGMGSTVVLAKAPQLPMLKANRGLQKLLQGLSTGRIARPMLVARIPGLNNVDRFYYTAANVEDRTISRFYGFTLEDPGRGALHQLESYLDQGRMYSADQKIDYVKLLPKIHTPTLLIAGEGDIMADVESKKMTFDSMSSADKQLQVFGRTHGHYHDYGHCDLVWSRHAPREIFPPLIDWMDQRQLGSNHSVAVAKGH